MSVTFSFGSWKTASDGNVYLMCGPDHIHRTCTSPEPCEDFAIYRICDHSVAEEDACGCTAFDVNVANTNAKLVLERLGFGVFGDDELAGNAEPDDIIGRALLGNIGRDDSGTEDVSEQLPGCARMVYCGVEPGYFEDALTRILKLAEEAKRRQVLVTWC